MPRPPMRATILASNLWKERQDENDAKVNVLSYAQRLTKSVAKRSPPPVPENQLADSGPPDEHGPVANPLVPPRGPPRKCSPYQAAKRVNRKNDEDDPAAGPRGARVRGKRAPPPKVEMSLATCKTFQANPDIFPKHMHEEMKTMCAQLFVAEAETAVTAQGPLSSGDAPAIDKEQPQTGFDPDKQPKHPGKGAASSVPNAASTTSGSVFFSSNTGSHSSGSKKLETLLPRFLPPSAYALGALIAGAMTMYTWAEDKNANYVVFSLAIASACIYNLYLLDTMNNGQ